MTDFYPVFIPSTGVTYTLLTADGTTYSTHTQLNVEKSIGDFNATSNFSAEFDNFIGNLSSAFSLNDEVVIYADRGTNPPTTKLFTGVIEKINFTGSSDDERVIISGRDYGAVLQDMTVQPIIFKDKDAGEIARTIVQNNAEGVVTTNNIDITTGTTIEKIGFNHKNVFDALKELAELSGCYFFVDEDKDVNFILKETIPSYRTFDKNSVYNAKFVKEDREVFNKVWVYGDRVLTGNNETFAADGTGSKFTLTDNPHNTRVTSHSVLIQPGGILGLTNPSTETAKYVIDFNEKQVVFVSGTTAGDNIPASGTLPISIDYERSTPIMRFKEDSTSITAYRPKTKIIKDDNIKSYSEADTKATSFLADNKDPKTQGTIYLKGVLNIDPGNTCIVNLPWHNIDYQTYTVLSASYSFNKYNNLSNKVMTLELNKKIADFTDTLKEQMLKTRNLEVGPLEGKFTKLETALRYVDVDSHYEVWAGSVGNNFIFHSPKHGLLESPDSRLGVGNLAQGILGSVLVVSGGY